MGKRWAAVAVLILFLIGNTLKVSMFDALLIYRFVSPFRYALQPGIVTKFLLVCFFFIVLLRFKNPLPFILAYGIQLIYMFANLSYHAATEGYLHSTQHLGLLSEAFELVKHKAVPSNVDLRFLFIDAPLFVAALALYPLIVSINRRFVFKKALVALAVTFASFIYKWQSADAAERPLAMLENKYSSDNSMVHKYGLLAFNITDLLKLSDSKSRIKRLDYGREITGIAADAKPSNIIMIQVESLDAGVVQAKHHGACITPFLNLLSKQSVYFPYVLSFHKAGSTSDCEFSVINSAEPFDDYPAMKLRNYDYPNSMLRPLLAAGFETAAFHGNQGSYFNRNVALKKMGFSSFYDIAAMGLREKGWGASDGDVLDFVVSYVQSHKEPFLYYVITMSSHEPFTAVNSYYENALFDDIRDKTIGNYFRSMAYVDGCLERFVNQVRASRPNTCLFIYGDHTPPIDAGADFKKATFSENGKLFEFVPLFIITPDSGVYLENTQAAMFLDFASTALAASHIDFTIRSHGKNLLVYSHESSAMHYGGETYLRREMFRRICRRD